MANAKLLLGASAKEERIGSLEGLRAIAILLVLLSHFTPGRDTTAGISSIIFKVASIGWSGVDLFFALSGYLITTILWNYKYSGKKLSHFWARRALRIIPIYFISLAFVFLIAPHLFGLGRHAGILEQIPYWLYVNNYVFPYENTWFTTAAFWSLALEMQFYVVWPIVICRSSPRRLFWICITLLFSSLAGRLFLVANGAEWSTTYMWLPWRMDGLIAGSLVATWLRDSTRDKVRTRKSYVFAAIISGFFILYVVWFDFGSSVFKEPENWKIASFRIILPTILSLFFSSLIILALSENIFSKILDVNFLKPISLYSYGLYIIHSLLIPTFELYIHPEKLARWLGPGDPAIYAYFIICSSISFALAALSYELIEKRFLSFKSRF